jgi:hypothetical protein
VLRFLDATESDQVVTVTVDETLQAMDGVFDLAGIDTAYSSTALTRDPVGTGITVSTRNIEVIPPELYALTLLTAGMGDVQHFGPGRLGSGDGAPPGWGSPVLARSRERACHPPRVASDPHSPPVLSDIHGLVRHAKPGLPAGTSRATLPTGDGPAVCRTSISRRNYSFETGENAALIH